MTVQLLRVSSSENGTFGALYVPGIDGPLFTVELPWKANREDVSCIPLGTYQCERTWSPRLKKKLYLIRDVPGRSGIRFHVANWPSELLGCIAPGRKIVHWPKRGWGVSNSTSALGELTAALAGRPFSLDIQAWSPIL